MDFKIEQLKDNAMDLAIGTGAAIVSLHALRRMPGALNKYSGWVLLGSGLAGLMFGGKVIKTASLVVASVGAVSALNSVAKENGVPAVTGVKGIVNKIVPQLNTGDGGASPMLGFAGLGNAEQMNEHLLSGRAMDEFDSIEGLGDASEKLLGALL